MKSCPTTEICEFIQKMNSSKRWHLEESAHNTVDNTKADGELWNARKRHIGVLKKIVKDHVRHIDETNLHRKMCLLYKWCKFNWMRGGVDGLEHGGANTNESVCGCCLGTIREGAPPDLMNLCWDVSSSVCVEWVPARCRIRTNGEKSRWQMSASQWKCQKLRWKKTVGS